MSCFQRTARLRLAIDNCLNRDLIATARSQGFCFPNPPLDSRTWEAIATDDIGNPGLMCSPEITNWLSDIALAATLFLVQQARQNGFF